MGDIAIKNFDEQVRNSGTESAIRGADGVGFMRFSRSRRRPSEI